MDIEDNKLSYFEFKLRTSEGTMPAQDMTLAIVYSEDEFDYPVNSDTPIDELEPFGFILFGNYEEEDLQIDFKSMNLADMKEMHESMGLLIEQFEGDIKIRQQQDIR